METSSKTSFDAYGLVQVLTEMSRGLEEIGEKLNPFLMKVKAGEFGTKNGISYLETKHLLLMFYCQCVMFYILLKSEGSSVRNHPVIRRLIEIRMFLEKIRPIDKKLHYQIEKLLKLAKSSSHGGISEKMDEPKYHQDELMYKPNPDMLISKIDENAVGKDGVYRPPMIAPTAMNEENSLKKRLESRAHKEALRRASRSVLVKELTNELEGKPEEIKEFSGAESKEMSREISRLEARAQKEENLFARVPLSKSERKKIKHLKRSRNGLMGMLDDFDEDIANLLQTEENKPSIVVPDESLNLKHLSRKHLGDVKMAIKSKRHRGMLVDTGLKKKKNNLKTKQIKSVRLSSK